MLELPETGYLTKRATRPWWWVALPSWGWLPGAQADVAVISST